MKVLYLATSGTSDPTKASLPLHLAANGSLEIGQEAIVVLAGDGADLVIGDNADRMEGVGLPPMRDLVAKLRDHQVPVYV
jgi:predicted peroxiredoxin